MSFLSGFAGGMAKGASSYMDDMQDEEDAQRKRVDDNIFSTTNTMFQNAGVVRDSRQKEIKDNKAYTNLLISKAPSLAKDPAKMAYVLSLPEKARQDVLKLTESDIFRTNNIPLADYFEAIDDPIEYEDPVTLTERVLGKTIDRPLEASQYYGVSTTEDKEVDKIVAGYAGGFATAYGMSADHAQGLLDSATQDVKMQRFKINWAHKKFVSSQNDALLISQVAAAKLNVHSITMNIGKAMEKNADLSINEDMLLWGSKQETPYDKRAFDTVPELAVKYKKSKHYRAARDKVIRISGQNMVDAGGVLDKSTESFLNATFPGYWGGEVDGPIEDLIPAKYYIAKGEDGIVGVYRGATLQQHIAHLQNKRGFDPSVQVEPAVEPTAVPTVVDTQTTTAVTPIITTTVSALKAANTELLEQKNSTTTLRGGRDGVVIGARIKAVEAEINILENDPTSLEAIKILSNVALDSGSKDSIEQAIEAIEAYTEEHKSGIKRGSTLPALSTLTAKLQAAITEDGEGITQKRGRGFGVRTEPKPIAVNK